MGSQGRVALRRGVRRALSVARRGPPRERRLPGLRGLAAAGVRDVAVSIRRPRSGMRDRPLLLRAARRPHARRLRRLAGDAGAGATSAARGSNHRRRDHARPGRSDGAGFRRRPVRSRLFHRRARRARAAAAGAGRERRALASKPGGRFAFSTVHPESPSVPRTLARRLGSSAGRRSLPAPFEQALRGGCWPAASMPTSRECASCSADAFAIESLERMRIRGAPALPVRRAKGDRVSAHAAGPGDWRARIHRRQPDGAPGARTAARDGGDAVACAPRANAPPASRPAASAIVEGDLRDSRGDGGGGGGAADRLQPGGAVGRGPQHGGSLDRSRRQLPRQPGAARSAARRQSPAPSWCSSARGWQYGRAGDRSRCSEEQTRRSAAACTPIHKLTVEQYLRLYALAVRPALRDRAAHQPVRSRPAERPDGLRRGQSADSPGARRRAAADLRRRHAAARLHHVDDARVGARPPVGRRRRATAACSTSAAVSAPG